MFKIYQFKTQCKGDMHWFIALKLQIPFCQDSMTDETRSSADADKPARRVYRSVKVTKHSTIPYVRYSFLLCNSNFVFKTCRFADIPLQKMLWPWNPGQRSLNVIEKWYRSIDCVWFPIIYEAVARGFTTDVFAYGPASRMYFSARTEGRISYGHLGRTNSCCF